MTQSMEDLVALSQSGDEQAQDELIRRMVPMAKSLAAAPTSTRSPSDYDDKVQEALIAIWRQAMPKFNSNHPSQASFGTLAWWWAKSGVKSWSKQQFNQTKKAKYGEDYNGQDPLPFMTKMLRRQFHAQEEETDSRIDVLSFLAQLPMDEQRVLFFRFWMGMDLRAVATVSGTPESGIKRMSRQTVLNIEKKGLARLRELMGVA